MSARPDKVDQQDVLLRYDNNVHGNLPSGPLTNYAPGHIANRTVASPEPGANLPASRAVTTI